ncbi:MAG: HEAT repeat domain-containing protein [Fibrobacteria bacterium]|nr:HEAT repeat domain-containing protein [Fibrobacteria bacterium]
MVFRRNNLRKIKKQLRDILVSEKFLEEVTHVGDYSPTKIINALFSFYCDMEPLVKWRAISATGVVARLLEKEDPAKAREIIRRLVWMLSEESGNIAWGAPEAMAEMMVYSDKLVPDFASILVSYIYEDGNFLEFEPLQAGALWGISRLAEVKPDIMTAHEAGPHLMQHLSSASSTNRAYAVWAMGLLKYKPAIEKLRELQNDVDEIMLYENFKLFRITITALAERSLFKVLEH